MFYPQISLKEAKKLLGKQYSEMSEDQVQELLSKLTDIARDIIKLTGSKNI